MTYEKAIKYIHGVSNFFCKPGLERVRKLCEGLGNPQNELKFIHVAGTNGKGSVCSMLSSILCSAGYKVGLYTSPYVVKFNERMRINGENISDEDLARITERVKAVADKMTDSPTEFELITAIGFEYFKEKGCEIVVLEVGMGGRLDATNVIDTSVLSIITGISIDHTAFLGDTIEQIAGEKAGIIKQNSITLWGGDNSSAEAVIDQKSAEMQSVLYKTDYSKLKITKSDLNGTTLNYKKREGEKITLLGSYQPRNAAIVLDAVDILNERGFAIGEDAARRGLLAAKWPARFEIIHENPTVIFDGAHNPQGISAAVESIKSYFGTKKVVVLTGVLRDKDYNAIAGSISEISSVAYTITPDNQRALSSENYAYVLEKFGIFALPCPSIEEAIRLGLKAAEELDTALVCLGSLYTYGEVMRTLEV